MGSSYFLWGLKAGAGFLPYYEAECHVSVKHSIWWVRLAGAVDTLPFASSDLLEQCPWFLEILIWQAVTAITLSLKITTAERTGTVAINFHLLICLKLTEQGSSVRIVWHCQHSLRGFPSCRLWFLLIKSYVEHKSSSTAVTLNHFFVSPSDNSHLQSIVTQWGYSSLW